MKAASFVTLLLVPLLVGACDDIVGDEDGEVEMTVDGVAYVAGDAVRVRLSNGTDESIFPNTCFMDMDVRSGNDWVATDYFADLPCPAIDPYWTGIAPGRSMNFTVTIPEEVPTGTYRLRLLAFEDEQGMDVATPAFEVQGLSAASPR